MIIHLHPFHPVIITIVLTQYAFYVRNALWSKELLQNSTIPNVTYLMAYRDFYMIVNLIWPRFSGSILFVLQFLLNSCSAVQTQKRLFWSLEEKLLLMARKSYLHLYNKFSIGT